MLKLYESCAKNTTRDQNIRRLWWLNLCCHVLLRCVRRPLMKPLPQTPAVFQPPRAERGPHAPWATCAWESHAFFFPAGFWGISCWWGIRRQQRRFGVERVLHASVTKRFPPPAASGLLWFALFFFMYILVFSQFTFVMGCKLCGHFRWLVS
jgi:hypothetical protein